MSVQSKSLFKIVLISMISASLIAACGKRHNRKQSIKTKTCDASKAICTPAQKAAEAAKNKAGITASELKAAQARVDKLNKELELAKASGKTAEAEALAKQLAAEKAKVSDLATKLEVAEAEAKRLADIAAKEAKKPEDVVKEKSEEEQKKLDKQVMENWVVKNRPQIFALSKDKGQSLIAAVAGAKATITVAAAEGSFEVQLSLKMIPKTGPQAIDSIWESKTASFTPHKGGADVALLNQGKDSLEIEGKLIKVNAACIESCDRLLIELTSQEKASSEKSEGLAFIFELSKSSAVTQMNLISIIGHDEATVAKISAGTNSAAASTTESAAGMASSSQDKEAEADAQAAQAEAAQTFLSMEKSIGDVLKQTSNGQEFLGQEPAKSIQGSDEIFKGTKEELESIETTFGSLKEKLLAFANEKTDPNKAAAAEKIKELTQSIERAEFELKDELISMDQLLKQLSPEAGEAKRAAFEADVNKQKDLIKNSVGKLGVVKSDLENISGLLAK